MAKSLEEVLEEQLMLILAKSADNTQRDIERTLESSISNIPLQTFEIEPETEPEALVSEQESDSGYTVETPEYVEDLGVPDYDDYDSDEEVYSYESDSDAGEESTNEDELDLFDDWEDNRTESAEPALNTVNEESNDDLDAEREAIENFQRNIEEQYGSVQSEEDYYNSQLMKELQEELRKEVFAKKQSFEEVVSKPLTLKFCGNEFTYKRFEQPVDFGDAFRGGDTYQDTAKNVRLISKFIVSDIANMFGGIDKITDLAVVSDILIVNGISYQPLLSKKYLSSLPVGVQDTVIEGCFAWLFDFEELRNMPNLTNLLFDSTDFLYKKVRVDITAKHDFEPKFMFKYCKNLINMQVGEYIFTRNDMNSHDDVFHRDRRSTEIADRCGELFKSGRRKCWSNVRDCFCEKDSRLVWRALSTTASLGGAVVTSAGEIAFNTGRLAVKGAGGLADSAVGAKAKRVLRTFGGQVKGVAKAIKDNF